MTTPPTLDAELEEARAVRDRLHESATFISDTVPADQVGKWSNLRHAAANTIDSLIARVAKGEALTPEQAAYELMSRTHGWPAWRTMDAAARKRVVGNVPELVAEMVDALSTPPLKETPSCADSANTGSNSAPSSQAGTGEGGGENEPR